MGILGMVPVPPLMVNHSDGQECRISEGGVGDLTDTKMSKEISPIHCNSLKLFFSFEL